MKITSIKQTSMGCGTAHYEVIGEGLTVDGVEKKLSSEGPFGTYVRINAEGTVASVICYYD